MKTGIDARGAVWYRGTGIGTYTYQLLRHLTMAGGDYRLFWPGEEYLCYREGSGTGFLPLETAADAWEQTYLPQQLQAEQIDLYHVPQNGIGLPAVKVCRQTATIHDLIPYLYPETVGKRYLQTFLSQMPAIMEQCDGIITVSECSKRDIVTLFGYPAERIAVIYEAAEPHYQPLDQAYCQQQLANVYGIRQPFLLYVGGFSPRKNVRALLVAYSQLPEALRRRYLLVCPGLLQGDDYQKLASALRIQDRVVFPGFVPVAQLPLFYNGATLFCYPSFYEGFGLPLLEAMACGCPVLAADTSSLPEVGGDSVAYATPYQSLAWRDRIQELLEQPDLLAALRRKGLARAAAFSWQQAAAETRQAYERFLA